MQSQPIGMAPQEGPQGGQDSSFNVNAQEFVPGGPGRQPGPGGPGPHQGGGLQMGGPGPNQPSGPGQGGPGMGPMPGPMGPGYPMNPQIAPWGFPGYARNAGYSGQNWQGPGMQPMPRGPGPNGAGGPGPWGAASARGSGFPDAWGPQMVGPGGQQFGFGPGGAPGLVTSASQGNFPQVPLSPRYVAMWNVASGHGEEEIKQELDEIDFVPTGITKLEGLDGAFALRYDEKYMAAAILVALDNTQGHVKDCGEKLRLAEYIVEAGAQGHLKGDGVPGEVQILRWPAAVQRLAA